MVTSKKYIVTTSIVLVAMGLVAYKYWDYMTNPWTRDGVVRAQVIQVTPRVSAPIVALPVRDNQFVKKGDVLFELDTRTFVAALSQARANLDKTRDDLQALEQDVEAAQAAVSLYDAQIKAAEATITRTKAELERTSKDVERASELLKRGNVSKRRYDQAVADREAAISAQNNALALVNEARAAKLKADADLAKAKANLGAAGDENARLRAAQAQVAEAELNLEFTKVRASVDGYVTNLNLRLGSQAVANQPILALVDINSYWISGFFRETLVGDIQSGDQAVVTLMSYPDEPLKGRVNSIGWGIAQQNGSPGFQLLPNIAATFEWIRLAQRVPVRVHLTDVPERIKLRIGTTASVLVRTGTAGEKSAARPVAVPGALR